MQPITPPARVYTFVSCVESVTRAAHAVVADVTMVDVGGYLLLLALAARTSLRPNLVCTTHTLVDWLTTKWS